MKTLLLFLALAFAAIAAPPPAQVEIPRERLVTLVHYLQVAEVYAKTGSKPDVPRNLTQVQAMDAQKLRTEAQRLLPVFQPGAVPKDRRAEVLALYVGAVKNLTLAREVAHGELVKWAEEHPKEWASEMRKNEQAARAVFK